MDILILGIPLGALVVALVEAVKIVLQGKLGRFIPLFAFAIGIGLSFLILVNAWWAEAIIKGLALGLIGMGLWSGGKKTLFNK